MYFRFTPSALNNQTDVFLTETKTTSTIEAVVFCLSELWLNNLIDHFGKNSLASFSADVEIINNLFRKGYSEFAVDKSGYYLLAAKKGGDWKLNINNSPFEITNFDSNRSLVEVELSIFSPVRDIDFCYLSALSHQSGKCFEGQLTGSTTFLSSRVLFNDVWFSLFEASELPEEKLDRLKSESEKQKRCLDDIKAYISIEGNSIEDIVFDNDWEEPSGYMTNIKLSNRPISEHLLANYPRQIIENAINDL